MRRHSSQKHGLVSTFVTPSKDESQLKIIEDDEFNK